MANRTCIDCSGNVTGSLVVDVFGVCGGTNDSYRPPFAVNPDHGFLEAGWATFVVFLLVWGVPALIGWRVWLAWKEWRDAQVKKVLESKYRGGGGGGGGCGSHDALADSPMAPGDSMLVTGETEAGARQPQQWPESAWGHLGRSVQWSQAFGPPGGFGCSPSAVSLHGGAGGSAASSMAHSDNSSQHYLQPPTPSDEPGLHRPPPRLPAVLHGVQFGQMLHRSANTTASSPHSVASHHSAKVAPESFYMSENQSVGPTGGPITVDDVESGDSTAAGGVAMYRTPQHRSPPPAGRSLWSLPAVGER